jgi:glyoxylase-like metal-dependent hydrolase (beta-lactamase superfamily II)
MGGDSFSSHCPFSIRKLNKSTHLIRERDNYGEYPHIYAKLCYSTSSSGERSAVIVLSDTGCATSTIGSSRKEPAEWDIGTFLEYTINPGNRLPYLVVTTHCHFDHIIGISKLPPTADLLTALDKHALTLPTTVLSSSYDKSFLTPYKNLNEHSLSPSIGLCAPHYKIGIWADDLQAITFTHPLTGALIQTDLTILHTPGHTPDSLAWYDNIERLINVGDSIYDRTSHDAENAPWGKEPPMQIMFDLASNLLDWWNSVKKVIAFVKARNEEVEHVSPNDVAGRGTSKLQNGFGVPLENSFDEIESCLSSTNAELGDEASWMFLRMAPEKKRVRLCAAHVTADTDALDCLLDVQKFMARVLRDEVPNKPLLDDPYGYSPVLWDDTLGCDSDGCTNPRFSVSAPLEIVKQGRIVIPKDEWATVESVRFHSSVLT